MHKDTLCAWIAAIAAAILYLVTLDPSVSYWDCPEYVLTASLLEIGHPPGNPFWTLAMRVATIPCPRAMHAVVINAASAIFMAASVFLLVKTIYRLITLARIRVRKRSALLASLTGGICFAMLDSTWFSAVEAEVYAMSTFLSILTVWLALLVADCPSGGRRTRLEILTAYILGLSIGVHQLNLLCIPVVALIWFFGRQHAPGQTLKAWGIIVASFAVVALILFGIMPGSLAAAGALEIFATETLSLPPFTGAIFFPFAVITVLVILIVIFSRLKLTRLRTSAWMTMMLFIGYSPVAILLIRGVASPPVNEAAPTDIFRLRRYVEREQYGTKPLFYGPTPFSRPMYSERFRPGNPIPDYSRYALEKGKPRMTMLLPDARVHFRSGFVSAEDSATLRHTLQSGRGYILGDYAYKQVMTPELNMLFPRITESSPSMMECYAAWAGMTPETMKKVSVSEVIDTLGNPAGRIGLSGERGKKESYRPTYLQNLRFFVTYQLGYMYFRYLMWNFSGRQNDVHSTGEKEHGNFITGFPAIDDAMLGDQKKLPKSLTTDNPGHHTYYLIPFLLGIIGLIWLIVSGRHGRRVAAVTAMLFLMTGPAIVVYLNQSPGEPRERDYAFIVSYMAYAIWVAFGILLLCKRRFVGEIGAIALVALLAQNYRDHDRSDRCETREYARAILAGKEGDIIFTHGDNFTFPLWYAQEVEGMAPNAAIIDISYLAMPEYVGNLMKQGDKGVRLTASEGDIAYGAYAFTRIPADADTVPIPLIEALRDLYSRKEGEPRFSVSRVTIPGLTTEDTIVIDLKKFNGGSPLLPFRQLMLLDILATNLQQSSPRPVSFLSHVKPEIRRATIGATRQEAFSETYSPHLDSIGYITRLRKSIDAIDKAREKTDPTLGTACRHYVDPVIKDQTLRQKIARTRAVELLDSVTHN